MSIKWFGSCSLAKRPAILWVTNRYLVSKILLAMFITSISLFHTFQENWQPQDQELRTSRCGTIYKHSMSHGICLQGDHQQQELLSICQAQQDNSSWDILLWSLWNLLSSVIQCACRLWMYDRWKLDERNLLPASMILVHFDALVWIHQWWWQSDKHESSLQNKYFENSPPQWSTDAWFYAIITLLARLFCRVIIPQLPFLTFCQ